MGFRDWLANLLLGKNQKQEAVKEVVSLQADINQNYSKFVAGVESFYNNTTGVRKNRENQEIKFKKAQLKSIDDIMIKVFKLTTY